MRRALRFDRLTGSIAALGLLLLGVGVMLAAVGPAALGLAAIAIGLVLGGLAYGLAVGRERRDEGPGA